MANKITPPCFERRVSDSKSLVGKTDTRDRFGDSQRCRVQPTECHLPRESRAL